MQRQAAADAQLEAALEQLLRCKQNTGMRDRARALELESEVRQLLGGGQAELVPLPAAGNDGVGVGLDVKGEVVDVPPGMTAEERQVCASASLLSRVNCCARVTSPAGLATRRVLLAARGV